MKKLFRRILFHMLFLVGFGIVGAIGVVICNLYFPEYTLSFLWAIAAANTLIFFYRERRFFFSDFFTLKELWNELWDHIFVKAKAK